jgi:Spy/CpxP family protein refolding chaperone
MRRVLRSLVVFFAIVPAFLSAGVLLAQPGGPPRGPGGPGGSLLLLAAREDVQQELQLLDEQRNKIDDVIADARERIGNEMRDMFRQMADLSPEERRERFQDIRTRMEDLSKEAEKDLEKALLPHQFARLKQISVQQRIQMQGAGALTSGDLAEALNLTDAQREKLEQRAAEVNKELQEKIAQLRLEARNKMLDVLTAEQRAKLDAMMGDGFALQDGFGGGFRGRRGRGGFFGGGRGGGDRGRGGQENNGTN